MKKRKYISRRGNKSGAFINGMPMWKVMKPLYNANFRGKDPRKEKVEINVRRECFMPKKEHVDFITLSGFFVEKAATTWAPRQRSRMV